MGVLSQKKGQEYERDVARWLSRITGVKHKPTPRSGGLHQIFDFDVRKAENKESVLDGVGIEAKNEKIACFPISSMSIFRPLAVFDGFIMMRGELFEKCIYQLKRKITSGSSRMPYYAAVTLGQLPAAFKRWVVQCEESAIDAGVEHWIVVFKREGKNFVLMKNAFFEKMKDEMSGQS